MKQRLQVRHLFLRRTSVVEIPDQADANAFLIQFFACQMAALDLISPPASDCNFSVRHPSPVADHEMVSQAVFHVPLAPVIAIHAFGISRVGSAVMNDNVAPLLWDNSSFIQQLQNGAIKNGLVWSR